VDKVALGQVFSEYFGFPCLIPSTAPHSSSIIRGWHNRSVVADVPSGLSHTPPQEKKTNETNLLVLFKINLKLAALITSSLFMYINRDPVLFPRDNNERSPRRTNDMEFERMDSENLCTPARVHLFIFEPS
jgi:hypothetical protein